MNLEMLYQAYREATERKADKSLPLLVRCRSMETVALCMRRMDNLGFTPESLYQYLVSGGE